MIKRWNKYRLSIMDSATNQIVLLNPDSYVISYQGKSVALTDKGAELIRLLLLSDNKMLSRDALLDRLWEGSVVSDDSLTNLVSITRAKLQEIGLRDLIKTRPKKGYELTQPVNLANEISQSSRTNWPSFPKYTLWLVVGAVLLGFLSITGNLTTSKAALGIVPIESLTDAEVIHKAIPIISQQLHHQSSNIDDVKTVSRNEVDRVWKRSQSLDNLAAELGLQYVVEGQITELDAFYILTLQLTQTENQSVTFSNAYPIKKQELTEGSVKEWEEIVALFLKSTINTFLPANSLAENIYEECAMYFDYVGGLSHKDLVSVGFPISEYALKTCEDATLLQPDNIDAHHSYTWLLVHLMDLSQLDRDKAEYYESRIQHAIERLPATPKGSALRDEVELNLAINKLDNPSQKDDVDSLFSDTSNLLNKYKDANDIEPRFANSAAIFLLRYARHLDFNREEPYTVLQNAVDLLSSASNNAPEAPQPLANMSRIYQVWGDIKRRRELDPTPEYAQAISYSKAAIQIEPKGMYLTNLALLYGNVSKYNASQNRDYQEHLRLAEETAEVAAQSTQAVQKIYNNLADLYATLMQVGFLGEADFNDYYETGIAHAERALSIKVDYPFPMFNIGRLTKMKSQADWAQAENDPIPATICIQKNSQGLNLRKNFTPVLVNRGYCYLQLSRYYLLSDDRDSARTNLKLAEQDFSAAISNAPKYLEALIGLSDVYLTLAVAAVDIDSQDKLIDEAIIQNANGLAIEPDHQELTLQSAKLEILKSKLARNLHTPELITTLTEYRQSYPEDDRAEILTLLIDMDSKDLSSTHLSDAVYRNQGQHYGLVKEFSLLKL